MPEINFRYTKNGVVKTTKYFEYGYPTFAFVDDIENEVVYLTKVAKVNGAMVTEVFDNENGVTFEENYIYLVDIKDIAENAIVEGRRIYSVDELHTPKPYGVSGKDKRMVPVIPLNAIAIVEEYVSSSSQRIPYPEGFNRNNCIVLSSLNVTYDSTLGYDIQWDSGKQIRLHDEYMTTHNNGAFDSGRLKLVLLRSDI